jgi:TRAP transporter 4TM/12TM fusion protein
VSSASSLSDETPARRLDGAAGHLAAVLAVGLSAYALYWVLFVVQPQIYRVSFLLVSLVLCFLLFPGSRRAEARVTWTDWLLMAVSVGALAWPIVDFDAFIYRAADPRALDLVCGGITILLVLEATRRAVGPILPVTAVLFLLYAWLGPLLDRIGLPLLAHRGYQPDRLIGTLFMTLEGIFGVPLDVAATYIILFTIYGAVLERSGAGQFFIDWAMAAMGRSRSAAAPGRTVTLAGFLLGTVSGSGVATTVMLGSVSWPLLRRAGFKPETGGAILSAAGIGALLSPPTLGAAAFLIAEFLRISYLQVLVMATIPTVLYYLSILLMIEADSRRSEAGPAPVEARGVWELTKQYGYHFTSLVAIAVLMVAGMSAFRAVFWSTVLAVALSFIRRDTAMTPRRLLDALRAGATGVLGVVATTATAGIIVGVVTLTGLGLKIAGIIVALAGGVQVLTVLYAALAVWILGLAVPVTASYILAAVMVAPALVQSGVALPAAHMFIFYYAVLSEVSPPTALSPFAAAAITGGNAFRTMMLTWKYTLPAFLVPLAFTLSPGGTGLLLIDPDLGTLWTILTAGVAVGALAAAFGGWMVAPMIRPERIGMGVAGVVLLFGDARLDLAGFATAGLVLVLHSWRCSKASTSEKRA